MMPLSAADRLGLVAWLRFMQVEGIGSSGRRALLQAFGLPEAVFAASHAALTAVVGAQSAERLRRAVPVAGLDSLLTQSVPADVEHPDQAILAALAWAEQPGHHLLTLADANYPSSLLTTDDPPLILYVRGRVELLSQPMFAVVGSRNATAQGERDAEAFSAALVAAGLTVVSGLALGIDAAAHRGGLSSSAGTVAVVGTGVDRLYPARNADLAREIVNLGAIVSEFPLGTPALASNFPRRNRIIAGLGLGCLVVEAALRSGSLITARLAAEAGREVFAIPGSIHSPLTRGCHQLIRQGAKLVESAQDILEELRWQSVEPAVNKENIDPIDQQSRQKKHKAGVMPNVGADETTAEPSAQQEGAGKNAALFAVDALQGDRAKDTLVNPLRSRTVEQSTFSSPLRILAVADGETAANEVNEANHAVNITKPPARKRKTANGSARATPAAAPVVNASNTDAATDSETRVIAALGRSPCDLDTLAARSHLTPAALLAILLPLELAGRVAQLPGSLYQRLD